ncbi:hypothetical protein B0H12DRAFT_1010323, partial [Mycena haematopus]
MDAKSSGIFWKEIKRLADPKPVPIAVTAASLKDVFEKRLNPPAITPSEFDSTQLSMNEMLAAMIPEMTDDPSPEGFFTREWNEDDMGRLKDHIRTHSLDSAAGEDQTAYMDLMQIPNEDLMALYNECTDRGDGPSICYRLVVLESCFLKGYTILSHWRILDWAKARNLIPPSQNGFRPGYRTNNNPFILRCLKEWARAHGHMLYVACIDFTNAFPSTDQPTLWLKLIRMGMGGKIFD